jgi:TetR/AcrR family transcriptional repressor of nem operon
MPRKKQFGVDDVMYKAMVAFWDHGYKATSLQDLVECMGINRASLYDTFGDKYSLFIETLHSYKIIYLKPFFAERMKAYSPRQAILGLFHEVSARVLKGEERNGCFVINTALELSPHDERVAKIVNQSFAHIERNFFRKLIEQGQASGEISRSVVPVTTARALLSQFIGLRVLSRSRPEKALLQSISNQVEALLPPGDHAALPHPVSRSLKSQGRKVQSPAALAR